MRKRVVIIDRDEEFARLIKYSLQFWDFVLTVNVYQECIDAYKNLERDAPDLIIMDLDFIKMKAPEFIEKVRQKDHRTEILILSEFISQEMLLTVAGNGITGYLLKQFAIQQIQYHLQSIFEGGSALDPRAARILLNAHQKSERSPLSKQETTVLTLLMHGLTYAMIAEELAIAPETSKTHIKNIYKKLNVTSKAEAVAKALSEKLVPPHFGTPSVKGVSLRGTPGAVMKF